MHRSSAALSLAAMVALGAACGGEEAAFRSTAPTIAPTVPQTAPVTTVVPSTAPVTTVAASTTSRPTTTRPTSTTTSTAPKGRAAPVGAVFSVTLGETVTVSEAGVSVTFTGVASDSRCRPGRQCIVAGKALVAVRVAQAGLAPADLMLDTDGPTSARYGSRTVELVDLSFGEPPVARMRVT